MQKTPQLIAHLNTLGVADVELKNNNVVKIHFQQGVSQKTWSKKELTDICAAFCAGSQSHSPRSYLDAIWKDIGERAKMEDDPAPVERLG